MGYSDDFSKKLVITAYNILEEKKAEDISIIYIGDISTISDYFIIASASNQNHLGNLSDYVEEGFLKEGIHAKSLEGVNSPEWILMDYGDVIIHLFSREARSFFSLDKNWYDGKKVTIDNL